MIQHILLMASPNGAAGGPASYMNYVFIVGMIAVFYFFMIRPQSKKAKDQRDFLTDLQKGTKVVTIAGMHGRITKVNENGTLEVEIDNNVKVVMEKSGISMEMTKALNSDAAAPVKK